LFRYFASANDKYDEISFITMNYDLLLEILLQYSFYKQNQNPIEKEFIITGAKQYHYPMTWIGLRSQLPGGILCDDNNREFPQIIKLHGSINWFWSGRTPAETIYYGNMGKGEDDSRLKSSLKPFIIPPVMNKDSFYNHIMVKALWKRAWEILNEADQIYVVGFSFPQTDTSVRFLFQSALWGYGKTIYIVNRLPEDKQQIEIEKYREIFGGNQCINTKFLQDIDVIAKLGEELEAGNV
jgi:hypothetical protein